jgi:hypothetical protein
LVEALAAVALVVGLIATTARSEAPAKPMSTAMGATGAGEVTFDHKIHAGDYRIPCLDCHAFADKSPVAGVPSGRKCMGCHKFVAKDKPAIEVLAQHTQDGEPLRWPRVFALPDFIHFTHRMHVRAQVACAECHGDVAAKHLVTQDQPFTMGRCVSCHEERHASRDCLTCHK